MSAIQNQLSPVTQRATEGNTHNPVATTALQKPFQSQSSIIIERFFAAWLAGSSAPARVFLKLRHAVLCLCSLDYKGLGLPFFDAYRWLGAFGNVTIHVRGRWVLRKVNSKILSAAFSFDCSVGTDSF